MGEIKSTLDLVMERTRHLTLSPDERAAQAREERRRSITAMAARFRRGEVSAEAFDRELRALPDPGEAAREAVSIVVQAVAPDGDNGPLFRLLEEVLHRDAGPLRSLLEDHRRRSEAAAERIGARLRDALAARGISGSAVEPNPGADPAWAEERDRLERLFSEGVRGLDLPPSVAGEASPAPPQT